MLFLEGEITMKHVRALVISVCLAVFGLTGCAQIEQAWGDLYYEKEPGQAGATAGQKQAQTTEQKQPQTQKQQAQKKLTPQQEAKATLERVFACEQKISAANAIKLIKFLGGKDGGFSDECQEGQLYELPKQVALNLFGEEVTSFSIGKNYFCTISESITSRVLAYEAGEPDEDGEVYGNYIDKRTKYGTLSAALWEDDYSRGIICRYK
jgi:hypothetical protein